MEAILLLLYVFRIISIACQPRDVGRLVFSALVGKISVLDRKL